MASHPRARPGFRAWVCGALLVHGCGPQVQPEVGTQGVVTGVGGRTGTTGTTDEVVGSSTNHGQPDLPPVETCETLPERWFLLDGNADFDDDGWLDLLLQGEDGLMVAWGDAGECGFVFAPGPRVFSLGEGRILVHDFDGDGRPDIIGLNRGVSSSSDNELAVARNQGERGFSAPTVSPIAGRLQAFIARADFDIDGDARPDPVISGYETAHTNNMLSPLFDVSGALTSAERNYVPGYCFLTSSALGDFDGDGRQDLAISGAWPSCNSKDDDTPIAIWRGGTTQTDEVDFVQGGFGPSGLETHDVDRDGRDDLVALFGYGGVNVFYSGEEPPEVMSAQEELELCGIAPVSGQMSQFQPGDIDGDGEPELVAAVRASYDIFDPCPADLLDHGVVVVDLEAGIVTDVFEELGPGQLLPLVPGGVHHWVWSEYDPDLDRSSLLFATLQR